MKDLEKQLSEGGLSAHDLEKAKKKLEMEKEELNQALEVCQLIVIKDRTINDSCLNVRKLRINWRVKKLVCYVCS